MRPQPATVDSSCKGLTDLVTDATVTLERAYRARLRPTPAQARMLQRLLGAKRFVWNWALARKDEAWREEGVRLNGIALSREFTALRRAPDTAWLGTLPRGPFAQVLRDFDRAWANFFAGRALRPQRKKRGSVNAVRFPLDQRREQVDRYYPSSKTCSGCGAVNTALQLRDRAWACGACGTAHHRDLNAAVNIEREGLRLLASESSTPRSGGIDARGESASAAGSPPPAGQAALDEPRTRLARGKPRTRQRAGQEPARRREG